MYIYIYISTTRDIHLASLRQDSLARGLASYIYVYIYIYIYIYTHTHRDIHLASLCQDSLARGGVRRIGRNALLHQTSLLQTTKRKRKTVRVYTHTYIRIYTHWIGRNALLNSRVSCKPPKGNGRQ